MSRRLGGVFVALAAAGWLTVGSMAALAQTKPAVTSLGPDFPKTAIFIGNSFFYYNNGMPGHVSLLEKAADPEHKQDYRGELFPAQRGRLLFVRRAERHRLQQAG